MSPAIRASRVTESPKRPALDTPKANLAAQSYPDLAPMTRRLGTLGAQFGHSRRSGKYLDHPEVPVPRSAPGVTRTPDLQVRSLRNVVAYAISDHARPVTTGASTPIADVR